jgi:hypothetical protein
MMMAITTTVGHHVQDCVLPLLTTMKMPMSGQEAVLPGEETGMKMMIMTTAGGRETIHTGLNVIAIVLAGV